jgi:hypothetical protein
MLDSSLSVWYDTGMADERNGGEGVGRIRPPKIEASEIHTCEPSGLIDCSVCWDEADREFERRQDR